MIDKNINILLILIGILLGIIVDMGINMYYDNEKQYLMGYEQGSWHTMNYNKYTDAYPCQEWRRTYMNVDLQTEDDFIQTLGVCGRQPVMMITAGNYSIGCCNIELNNSLYLDGE